MLDFAELEELVKGLAGPQRPTRVTTGPRGYATILKSIARLPVDIDPPCEPPAAPFTMSIVVDQRRQDGGFEVRDQHDEPMVVWDPGNVHPFGPSRLRCMAPSHMPADW